MYFLVHFSPNTYERHMVGGPWTDCQFVASKLQEMGFTKSRSQIADWIAKPLVSEHRSLLSWAERCVESVFNYDIFLNEYGNSYPYQDSMVDEWFDVTVNVSRSGGVVETVQVPFYNIATLNKARRVNDEARRVINEAGRVIDEKAKTYVNKELGLECWFHGTDHDSAKHIVENGIDLKKGMKNLDFSHGGGFYLNPDGFKAVKWAKSNEHAAVIIFKASREMRDKFQLLDLRDNGEHWKKVVKWNRSGENKKECLDDQAYEECDYIRGPMAGDNTRYAVNWEPQNNGSEQICVKKKDMADDIGHENILGVVCWYK